MPPTMPFLATKFFGTELVPEAICAGCLFPLVPFVSPSVTASGAGWPSGGLSVVLVHELRPA